MNDMEANEIREAIDAADNALDHLYSARKYLDSAGNWGLLDMLGGGQISLHLQISFSTDLWLIFQFNQKSAMERDNVTMP